MKALGAVRALVGFPTHLHRPFDELGLEPRGVLELGADAGMKLLPDARHAEKDRRLHLFEVLGNGLDRLGEVDARARRHRHVKREHLLGDVRQGQVRKRAVGM